MFASTQATILDGMLVVTIPIAPCTCTARCDALTCNVRSGAHHPPHEPRSKQQTARSRPNTHRVCTVRILGLLQIERLRPALCTLGRLALPVDRRGCVLRLLLRSVACQFPDPCAHTPRRLTSKQTPRSKLLPWAAPLPALLRQVPWTWLRQPAPC